MKSPTYTPEFRAEAVKLVLAQGLTLEEAAQRIAMPKGTLANWVSAAKRGTDPKAPPGSRSVAELEAEVKRLTGLSLHRAEIRMALVPGDHRLDLLVQGTSEHPSTIFSAQWTSPNGDPLILTYPSDQ